MAVPRMDILSENVGRYKIVSGFFLFPLAILRTALITFPLYFYRLIIYHLAKPLYFLAKPYTIWRNYRVLPDCMGFCQIVSLLPNRMRFCQKVSLSPNCIRLSPNRLYFLAKEPQNKSSPTPECKIAPKNTRK